LVILLTIVGSVLNIGMNHWVKIRYE